MQPDSEQPTPVTAPRQPNQGERSAGGGYVPPPGFAPPGFAPPGFAPSQSGPGARTTVSRPGVIVLVALLTELVLIAAAANQWVTKAIYDHASGHADYFFANVGLAVPTYGWRFSPAANDQQHVLAAQFTLLGVVFVLTGVFVLASARGAVTFGRVFFGTWAGVIVATEAGAVARGFVIGGSTANSGTSAVTRAFFGPQQPTGYTFVASLSLGLLVALVAALAAVLTRRTVVADGPVEGGLAGGEGDRAPADGGGLATTAYSVPPSPPMGYARQAYPVPVQPGEEFSRPPYATDTHPGKHEAPLAPNVASQHSTTRFPVIEKGQAGGDGAEPVSDSQPAAPRETGAAPATDEPPGSETRRYDPQP